MARNFYEEIDISRISLYNVYYSRKILKGGVQSMKTLPQISEAEFEVMKVIWKHAPINTNEITDKLTKTT